MKLKLFTTFTIMAALASSCAHNSAETTTTNHADCSKAVIENIMTRKSVRQFTSQPVSKDTLEIILKAGMAAPSAMNKQPWAFVVLDERAALDSLNAVHPYANLKTATAAIIVCGDMEKTIEGPAREYWVQDCSAVSENILLAAHGLGLGAVWCGVYPMEERIKDVSEVLSLPANIIPLNIITMGYPAVNPDVKDKWNPEVIHWQKW